MKDLNEIQINENTKLVSSDISDMYQDIPKECYTQR